MGTFPTPHNDDDKITYRADHNCEDNHQGSTWRGTVHDDDASGTTQHPMWWIMRTFSWRRRQYRHQLSLPASCGHNLTYTVTYIMMKFPTAQHWAISMSVRAFEGVTSEYKCMVSVMRWLRYSTHFAVLLWTPWVWSRMSAVYAGEIITNSTHECTIIQFADTMKRNF